MIDALKNQNTPKINFISVGVLGYEGIFTEMFKKNTLLIILLTINSYLQ